MVHAPNEVLDQDIENDTQSSSESILTQFGEMYTIFWPSFEEKVFYFRTFCLSKSDFLQLLLTQSFSLTNMSIDVQTI